VSTPRRVVCVVLDGVGVGAAPDADRFGDHGANSIANTAARVGGLRLPHLARMGLGRIVAAEGVPEEPAPTALHGRMRPAAPGKDSTSGHWELMGCVLRAPLPTYPAGFPAEIIDAFCAAIGRPVLGNRADSGTAIIEALGARHLETGFPIVYTSQDSVFQVAAHEDVVPVETLYRMCETARHILAAPHAVGRVIARPFTGRPGTFRRTARRRDFSLAPPGETVLDRLAAAGLRTLTIGKIDDLFAGRGIAEAAHTVDNADGMRRTLAAARAGAADFVFTNLVDFDTMWGHRNDARAYALGLEEFDSFLGELLPALPADTLLIITSDHGNDPTTPGTDHSREYVPLLAWHRGLEAGRTLADRATLADAGATVARALGVEPPAGESLLDLVWPRR
jgi:phosphopentomutase